MQHNFEEDILSNSLYNLLEEAHVFESKEECQEREFLLRNLYCILKNLAKEIIIQIPEECKSRNREEMLDYSDENNNNNNNNIIKMYTFGSFRLGVHGPGADIDILCVGPESIEAEQFFPLLVKQLQQLCDDQCTNISWIREAYVPVCSFTYFGVDIDLVYARVPLPHIKEQFDIFNDIEFLLPNLDQKTILSLNGSRVTDRILSVIAKPHIEIFKLALRAIKLWAKRRGIYSNKLGYLGGVSWAILVAYICHHYPNCTTPADIVRMFFHWWHLWQWPKPVRIREITNMESNMPITAGLAMWNPEQNIRDRTHLMPILTPAHPSMNTTYNVSKSTLRVIKQEITRGHELCLLFASNNHKNG